MRTIIASLVGIIAIAMMPIFLATAAHANDDIRIWHTERLHTSNALRDWLARNMIDGKWGILDTGEERYRHNNLITGAINTMKDDGKVKLPPNDPRALEALKHELAARWEMPLSGDIARKTFEANALDLPGAKIRGYYFPKNWVYRAPTTHTSTAKPTTVATVTPTHEADIPKLVLHIRGIHDRLRNADAENATEIARARQEVKTLAANVSKTNTETAALLADMTVKLDAFENGGMMRAEFDTWRNEELPKLIDNALEELEERLNQRIVDATSASGIHWKWWILFFFLISVLILIVALFLLHRSHKRKNAVMTESIVAVETSVNKKLKDLGDDFDERIKAVSATASTAKTTAESADAKASRALKLSRTLLNARIAGWEWVEDPPTNEELEFALDGTVFLLKFRKDEEIRTVKLTRLENGFLVDGITDQRKKNIVNAGNIVNMIENAFKNRKLKGIETQDSNGDAAA